MLGQPKPHICSFGNPQPAVLQEGKGREVVRGAAAEPRAASGSPPQLHHIDVLGLQGALKAQPVFFFSSLCWLCRCFLTAAAPLSKA